MRQVIFYHLNDTSMIGVDILITRYICRTSSGPDLDDDDEAIVGANEQLSAEGKLERNIQS